MRNGPASNKFTLILVCTLTASLGLLVLLEFETPVQGKPIGRNVVSILNPNVIPSNSILEQATSNSISPTTATMSTPHVSRNHERTKVDTGTLAVQDAARRWGLPVNEVSALLPKDRAGRELLIKEKGERDRFIAYQRLLTLKLSKANISEDVRSRAMQAMLASSPHETYAARVTALEQELRSILPSDLFNDIQTFRDGISIESGTVTIAPPSVHAQESEMLFYQSALGLNESQSQEFKYLQKSAQESYAQAISSMNLESTTKEERTKRKNVAKEAARSHFLKDLQKVLTEAQFNRFLEIESSR